MQERRKSYAPAFYMYFLLPGCPAPPFVLVLWCEKRAAVFSPPPTERERDKRLQYSQ